jgi:hypothetical protein
LHSGTCRLMRWNWRKTWTDAFLLLSHPQILVWHTQSKKNPNAMALDMGKYNNTNLVHLKQILV